MSGKTPSVREAQGSVFRHRFGVLGHGSRPCVLISPTAVNAAASRVLVCCSAHSGPRDAFAVKVTDADVPGLYDGGFQPHNLRSVSKLPWLAADGILLESGLVDQPSRQLVAGVRSGFTPGYVGPLPTERMGALTERFSALFTGDKLNAYLPGTVAANKDDWGLPLRQWQVVVVRWILPNFTDQLLYAVLSHDTFHARHPHSAFVGAPLRPVADSTQVDNGIRIALAGERHFSIAIEEMISISRETGAGANRTRASLMLPLNERVPQAHREPILHIIDGMLGLTALGSTAEGTQ